ncbi:MAG: RNA pseudouridine synthase [bacterium]|nr:RNA pseudouridine synthase [bacterium]
MTLKVFYEDNHIIAVYKPAGVLAQPDLPDGESLMDDVKKYLKDKYKKQGNVFLGLVHRLDRNVSGVVLFAKTSKGAARLSEQFRNNEIKKIYHAVAEGKVSPTDGDLTHYLKKDENRKIAIVSDSPKTGYDRSELEYETVKSDIERTLLKINLKTGRFHQIRAQLSAVGHPVVGDKKYGAKSKMPDGSLALCATEIEFKTATTDEIKKIRIDNPSSWDNLFQ